MKKVFLFLTMVACGCQLNSGDCTDEEYEYSTDLVSIVDTDSAVHGIADTDYTDDTGSNIDYIAEYQECMLDQLSAEREAAIWENRYLGLLDQYRYQSEEYQRMVLMWEAVTKNDETIPCWIIDDTDTEGHWETCYNENYDY